MKQSHFNVVIGNKRLTGFWGTVVGILIAIPILFIAGVIVLLALSAAGVAVTFALGIAGVAITLVLGVVAIGIVVVLISLLLPQKWRDKLGMHLHSTRTQKSKPEMTKDGKPIVDVDYKEE